jgi:hypothetical protein
MGGIRIIIFFEDLMMGWMGGIELMRIKLLCQFFL